MPTRKTALIEEPAVPTTQTIVIEEAPRRSLPALAIAGITVGGVLVAGLLFGGGVLLGEHLSTPTRGGFGTNQQGFPGGPNHQGFPSGPNGNGFGGPGPVRPGQGGQQQGGPQGNGS